MTTTPFQDGKLTEEIKTRLPECTAEAFERRAREAGASVSELLRDVLCMLEHGATYGELVAGLRRKSLRAFGPNVAQEQSE